MLHSGFFNEDFPYWLVLTCIKRYWTSECLFRRNQETWWLDAMCAGEITQGFVFQVTRSCKEKTSKLIFDFETETLESFYDLLHLGEGCINSNHRLLDLKHLLLNLGVQEDKLTTCVCLWFQKLQQRVCFKTQARDNHWKGRTETRWHSKQ